MLAEVGRRAARRCRHGLASQPMGRSPAIGALGCIFAVLVLLVTDAEGQTAQQVRRRASWLHCTACMLRVRWLALLSPLGAPVFRPGWRDAPASVQVQVSSVRRFIACRGSSDRWDCLQTPPPSRYVRH